jgi:virginiamycin B lyase
MASTGDYGYDNHLFGSGAALPSFPATSPYVVAVGGTELNIVKNARTTEKVWPRGGSGCSGFESTKTTGQKETEENESRKGCTSDRTDSDVAADASCETPVSFYSTPGFGGWNYECGTSASSPFVAGVEAHATSATKKLGANAFYKKPSMLFHVSEGSNGECGTETEPKWYLCHATKEGYNGPTGMGTPDGVFVSTSAPVVATEAATSITKTGATLNGTVNPEGVETKYYFEYDTKEYKLGEGPHGTKTAEASAGSGTSNVKESKAITGLADNTKYDFRIVATNTNKETSYGANKAFTTLPNAPENTVLPVATPETPHTADPESTTTGTWTNSPSSYAYEWERCNATGGECKEISGATSSQYTPVEADLEDTLVVKVTAKNSGGEGSALSKATKPVKPGGEISEYELPSKSGPTGITAGPEKEDLWFTDYDSSEIGKITTSGMVTEYSLPKGSDPYYITAGPDGDLWFTDFGASNVGKITTSGTVTEYALPKGSTPVGIVAGPEKEDLWFAVYDASKIGKITTSGTITEYSLPTSSGPSGITAGPDGNVWFTDAESSKIGKITTSGTITEYALPEGTGVDSITTGPDGNLWFTEHYTHKVGKITTSGTITEYTVGVSGEGELEGITAGPDGNLWFVDRDPGGVGRIGRITTSGTVTWYSLSKESQPFDMATGPDGNVWFTAHGTSKMGKITP